MTICPQCNGKKACAGTEGLVDQSGNTQSFQAPGRPQPHAQPCTQCGGVGYY